jgi:hypothetical protein
MLIRWNVAKKWFSGLFRQGGEPRVVIPRFWVKRPEDEFHERGEA